MIQPHKICLIAVGSTTWMAGHIYIQHIIKALTTYYPDVELHLIIHPLQKKSLFAREIQQGVHIHRYIWHKSMPLYKRVISIIYAGLKGRKLHSLSEIIEHIHPDFVYPSILANDLPNGTHWIPDFQHKILPEYSPGQHYTDREQWVKDVIHEARHLVVSSHTARGHLQDHYNTDGIKIDVLPFRASFDKSIFNHNPSDMLSRYDLPKRYYIYSSNLWKHKNHMCLLKAMEHMIKADKQACLVLTGTMLDPRNKRYKEEIYTFIKDTGIEAHIKILGMIPRIDQLQLLRQSVAIVQPSFFEGWSSLVEDARAIGKRIIVSDIPIHREQAPYQGIFFDPNNVEELVAILTEIWRTTEAGPDPESEVWARHNSDLLCRSFADKFVDIAINNARL
ncbi:MAG: glycosyltransferase family 1 protein [Saprospiraceae bacterium]